MKEFTSTDTFAPLIDYTRSFFFLSLSFRKKDQMGGNAKEISGVDAILYAPLVSIYQRFAWELYTTQNQGWIEQGLAYQNLSSVDPGEVPNVHPNDAPHDHAVGETQ
jgi:hypothetical protein